MADEFGEPKDISSVRSTPLVRRVLPDMDLTDPLPNYLGKRVEDPDLLNDQTFRYSNFVPARTILPDAKTGWRPENGKDAELPASKIADFLTFSMQMALFKRPVPDIIDAAKYRIFGNNAHGRIPDLSAFNPYSEKSWGDLADNTDMKDVVGRLKEQWEKDCEKNETDPKFHSLKTLFVRCGEEIAKALSEKFHKKNGVKMDEESLKHVVLEAISNVTTAHPNGKLADEAEPLVRDVLVGMFRADPMFLRRLARWSGRKEELEYSAYFDRADFGGGNGARKSGYQLLAGIWDNHKKPKKMTPEDERQRQRQWAVDMYNSCQSYMEKFHEQFAPVDAGENDFAALTEQRKDKWGLSFGFTSLAELDQMRPPNMRSWVIGDADGKTATQPETVRRGIMESRVHTMEMHRDALKEISRILSVNHARVGRQSSVGNEFTGAETAIAELTQKVEAEIEASKENQMGKVLSATALAKRLAEIKEEFEGRQVVFDRLDRDGYPVHSYSKLDELYVNVRRCGDFFPQVEIRQNAAQQKTAMEYVGRLLQGNGVIAADEDISEHPEILLQKMKEQGVAEQVQGIVAEEYSRLTRKLNPDGLADEQLLAIDKEAKKPVLSLLRDKNLAQDEMYARQILGIFMLQQQYPSAISTYVIAESAQADLEFKKRHAELHPENTFEVDKIDELGTEIVRLGMRDYRNLMALEQMTQGVEKQVVSDDIKGITKLMHLFEDPQSILNQIKVWQEMIKDKDIVERMLAEARPVQMFDNGHLRPMTVADAKKVRGLKQLAGDKNIYVYEGPEWMDAGSDASGRGTTLMNIIIAMVREMKDEILFHCPVEFNGQKIVILPKNHAGIGAGNPRSQDKGNTLGSEIIAQTNQGMLNLLSLVNPALSAMDKQLIIEQHRTIGNPEAGAEHEERVKWPDYKGNGISALTKEQKVALIRRVAAVVESRVDMVYSEPYTQHLTNNTDGLLANSMNHSAREAKRDGGIREDTYPARTPYETLRFIGAVHRNYVTGECGPETQVLKYFEQDPAKDLQEKDGVSMLSDATRKELIFYHQNADYATNALSGLTVVATYANFDNAWKMAGFERVRRDNGEYAVKMPSGEEHSIRDLCKLLEEYKAKGEAGLPEGIHPGHLALADHDRQFEGMARHVYELYYRMQHGDKEGNIGAGEEKTLLENLRTFTPERMYEVMPPHMAEVCKKHRELMDFSRTPIAEDHRRRMETGGKEGTLDISKDGYFHAIVHDMLLETGPTPIRREELAVVIPAQIEQERGASEPRQQLAI